jgi:hypothetical protein
MLRISAYFRSIKIHHLFDVNTKHVSFLFVKYGTRKTKHERDVHKIPKFLEDYPIRNFCHLLVVVVCGKCSASLLVWMLVGKEAPSVCGEDDGVQMFVR